MIHPTAIVHPEAEIGSGVEIGPYTVIEQGVAIGDGTKVGARVTKLQRVLRALSYDIKADGYYGLDIKEAIQDFQKRHGLDQDGIAGPGTLKALIKAYGVDKFVKNFKVKL